MYENRLISYLFSYDELKYVQSRDRKKKVICKEQGISLIIIPYWWDRKIESIAATIHSIRPDIQIPSVLLKGNVITDRMIQQTKGTVRSFLDLVSYFPAKEVEIQ